MLVLHPLCCRDVQAALAPHEAAASTISSVFALRTVFRTLASLVDCSFQVAAPGSGSIVHMILMRRE